MRNSLCKMQYVLLAVALFALSACGTTGTSTAPVGSPTSKVTANLVIAKSASKSVSLAADVTKTRLMVSGPSIATVKKDFANNSGGTIECYPGLDLVVTAQGYNAAGTLIYEGSALNQVIAAGDNTVTIELNDATQYYKAENQPCLECHETTRDVDGQNLVVGYKQSKHYFSNISSTWSKYNAKSTGCAGCHGDKHQVSNPATSGRCYDCHGTVIGLNSNHLTKYTVAAQTTCGNCHAPHNAAVSCVACHKLPQDLTAIDPTLVNDNNGVRAITGDFYKRSHHVSGRAVKDSDCAVCHLEGKADVIKGKVVIDTTYHMKDDKIYLRNGNTSLVGNQTESTTAAGGAWASGPGKVAYAWQPSAPNHTLMDQFCFSCHNVAGAPNASASLFGVAGYNGTALNPFDDSVSNAYDQLSRVNVVGVYEQFDTGNTSHHAVRGAKYTLNNLTPAMFTNISTANANFMNAGVAAPIKGTRSLDTVAGSLQPIAGTMFETGKFVTTYTTLNGNALADNNVLHCGDCHTVGQFRAADVGSNFNYASIGAHGSNNEYMLRNKNGDDSFNKDALVCFICHKEQYYNSDAVSGGDNYTGPLLSGAIKHAGANSGWDCNGTIINSAGKVGIERLQLEEGAISSAQALADIAAGKYTATSGSPIFGYSCAGCHNSSDKKTFGGIHGNASSTGVLNTSYISYSGGKSTNIFDAVKTVSRKPYRFLPGLQNFRFNGGDSADQWMVRTLSTSNKQGCYTLNGASASRGSSVGNANPPTKATLSGTNVSSAALANDNGILGSWGGCTDHGGSSYAGGRAVTRTLLRPLTY
jgi:hypothetical protein